MIEAIQQLTGETIGHIGVLQMVLRALIVFAYGLVLGRLAFTRAFGRWSPPDILVTVIVGSNLSRTLTGPAPLLPTLTATTAMVAAYWLISKLASISAPLDWLFKGRAMRLVRAGKLDGPALRRAALSDRDFEEAMRERGIRTLGEIDESYLERGGKISFLRTEAE
jgi:uncharacterized membrane protein YcaP (DUF421 family)